MIDKSALERAKKKTKVSPMTASIDIDFSEQVEAIKSVQSAIEKLNEVINNQEPLNIDALTEQIKQLHKSLDLTDALKLIQYEVRNSKVETVSVKEFNQLIKAVKENKPVKVDLATLEKAVIEVQQRIQDASVTSQAAEDFQPVRRVVKVGNRLIYDDQPTPSRGGGGGGSSSVQILGADGGTATVTNGKLDVNATVNASIDTTGLASDSNQTNGSQKTQLVDSGGEAVTVTGGKLDVNASVDTTGLATSAKQDTIIGHLDGVEGILTTIDTDTGALAATVSGSEVQVDVVAALPSGTNNIGDVDVATLPTTVHSADYDTGAGTDTTLTFGLAVPASGGAAVIPGSATAGLKVDLGTDNDVTVTGTVTVDGSGVTQPVSNAGLTELAAAINSSKVDVNIVSSDVASGGTSAADDADFTAGTTAGTPSMGVYESTPTTVTDGDLGTVGITSGRRLKTSATVDAALPVGTNSIGQVTANAGTNLNTSALALESGGNLAAAATSLAALDNAVSGNELQVDVVTMPTTTVQATNLDIRDIDAATDDITIHGDVGIVDQLDLTNSNPLAVAVVDADGTQVSSFGGGTQYTEDAAAAANPVGTALNLVRDDARGGSLTTTDGDNLSARGTNAGELYVKHVDTIPVTQSGTWNVTNVSGTVSLPTGAATSAKQDTIIGHVDGIEGILTTIDGDTSALAGAVSGTEVQVDVLTMPSVAVTNAGTFATQVDGSALTALQLIDDTVATLGTTTYTETSTKGNVIGAVRRDADTTLVDTTNEIGPLQMDANGRLKVEAFSGETLPVSLTSTTVTGTVAVTQSGTWDEVGINDSGNSITVDNPQLSVVGSGTEATAMRVTIATDSTGVLSVDDNGSSLTVDGTVTANLAAGTNNIGDVDILSIAAGDNNIGNVDVVTLPVAFNSGTVSATTQRVVLATDVALPAGTNAIGKLSANSGVDIGDVDITSIAAGTNTIGNVGLVGRTSGGLTIFRSIDIDETEEEVKATAGQLFSITAFNRTAAPLYLKFYNATAANVTVGTTTPVLTFVVPANADSDGAGFIWNNDIGLAFGTAITVACTTGVADNDTGAPGANDCVINLGYS